MSDDPRTEPFPKRDLEEERIIEQHEGIVADKGKVEERPAGAERAAPRGPQHDGQQQDEGPLALRA